MYPTFSTNQLPTCEQNAIADMSLKRTTIFIVASYFVLLIVLVIGQDFEAGDEKAVALGQTPFEHAGEDTEPTMLINGTIKARNFALGEWQGSNTT